MPLIIPISKPSTSVGVMLAVTAMLMSQRRALVLRGTLIAVGVCGLAARQATAAEIAWGDSTDIGTAVGNSSDVLFGEVVEAFNAVGNDQIDTTGPVTVNGVTFAPTTSLLDGDPKNTGGISFSGNTADGDPEYHTLLNSLEFGGGGDLITLRLGDGDGDASVDSAGLLTPGNSYQIQIWFVDTRTNQDARVMRFGDGNGNTVDLNDQYAIGTFTADASTQDLTLDAQGFGNAHFTAYSITGEVDKPTLQVNTVTGAVTLMNLTSTEFDIDYYQLTSESGSLSVDGWSSLEDQDLSSLGFPAGDGAGNGWEELGDPGNDGSPPNAYWVAEGYLTGSSVLGQGVSLPLGSAFTMSGAQDLELQVRLSSGAMLAANVVEVTSLPGDYDGNGAVEPADYIVWRNNYGSNHPAADGNGDGVVDAADYTVWRDNLTLSGAPTTSAAAIPEPTAWCVLGGIAWFCYATQRFSGRSVGDVRCAHRRGV